MSTDKVIAVSLFSLFTGAERNASHEAAFFIDRRDESV
jgi:hypothetical protein